MIEIQNKKKGQIHFFTGGKGGVGKTIFSLCTLFYYKNLGKKVLLLDLNTTNPNLLHIFYNIFEAVDFGFDSEGIQMRALKINENLYIAHPAKIHILPSGIPAIVEIYHSIKVAYEQLQSKEQFEPDAIIVDSNLSLANFWTDSPESQVKIKDLYELITNQFTPYHWHIWALSDFLNVQDVESRIVNKTLAFPIISTALEEIKSVWGNHFNETDNLINVFNIYSLYPHGKLDKTIRERLFFWDTDLDSGTREVAFYKKREFSSNGISLEKLKTLLMDNYKKILNQNLFKLSDKNSQMYEDLGDAIKKLTDDKEFEGKIPKNLFVIGTYRWNLVGFTDLKAPKCDSIDELEKSLSPIPSIVKEYLNNSLGISNK